MTFVFTWWVVIAFVGLCFTASTLIHGIPPGESSYRSTSEGELTPRAAIEAGLRAELEAATSTVQSVKALVQRAVDEAFLPA